VSFAILKRR